MVKKGHFKVILIFLFSLVLIFSNQSQNRKYFIIKGKIISESEFIENSSVQIIKNDESSVSSRIPEHGRFRLELDYNAEYRLIFTQKGFLPKVVFVNTELPDEAINRPSNFPHFVMAVKLFKDNQEAANLYSGDLIQLIIYLPQKDCFARVPIVFDRLYVEKVNSNQNQ